MADYSRVEVPYEIKEYGGILDDQRGENGWALEVNLVSWNGAQPKIDIRSWDAKHERMSRGITLTEDQARKLVQLLNSRYRDRHISSPERDTAER